MIRLPLIIAAGAVAMAAAVTPAVVGLTGNPSFSHEVTVRVPEHARIATFPSAGVSPLPSARGGEPEPGDDRHRRDDLRRDETSPQSSGTEAGDDRGHGEGGSRGGEHG